MTQAVAKGPQTDRDHDWGDYTPLRRREPDKRSKLLKARENHPNDVINACPCGCADGGLDANTYCKHLVGFTIPGDPDYFEPQAQRPDGTVFTNGSDVQVVLPTDKLVWISMSARVYRENPEPLKVVYPPKKAKKPSVDEGESDV